MSEIEAKSYRYLRTAMVGLLVALFASVVHQAWQQKFHLLGSVSAYYYTPAQAIFVGALIGLGACMIALKGTTGVEDISLNLGGMFAAVVAIVPTARGKDFQTAVEACKQAGSPLLTDRASTGLDCPTIEGLANATKANVENNMVALLVLGAMGLAATAYFALKDRKTQETQTRQGLWFGFGLAVTVWVAGAITLWTSADWFVKNAHFIAAAGLLLSIFVVAVANAVRRGGQTPSGETALARTVNAVDAARGVLIRRPGRIDRYAWLAWTLVAVTVLGLILLGLGVVSLFLVEILIALVFVVFWIVQTFELEATADDQPATPELASVK